MGRGGVPVKNVGLVTKRLSGFAELNRKSNGVDPVLSGLGVVNFSSCPFPSAFPKRSPLPFAVTTFVSDGDLGSPEKNTPLLSTACSFWPVQAVMAIRRVMYDDALDGCL